jgi:iron complex outermembrane receptor protein
MKLTRRRILGASVLVAGSTGFFDTALAQTASGTAALEEIIVEGTRLQTTLERAPGAVSVVGLDDIQLGRQQLTLDESLSRVPGLFMQSNYNFSRDLRLSIRGFGARSAFGIRGVKIVVDGIPETLPDGQGQVDTIDLGTARQIEVIRGPSSSLYGNASGGVINVISEGGTAEPYATARLSTGAFDFSKLQLKTGGTAGPMDYVVSFSDMSLDGYRDHSEWENTQLSGRFNFDLAGDSNFLAVVNYTDQPISNDSGAVGLAQAIADPRSARDANVDYAAGEALEQTRVGFVYTLPLADEHELAVRTYHVSRDFEAKLPFAGGGAVAIDRQFNGGGISYTYSGDLGGMENRLIVGLDIDDQDDDRRRFDNLLGIVGPLTFDQNESVQARGVFLQDELSLSETVGLRFGLRYDEIEFSVDDRFVSDGDDSGSRKLDNVNPMFGIVGSLTEALTVYGTYSTAFETPTTTEFADPDGGGGFNPNLEPQEAENLEIGVRGQLGDATRYEAALFSIDVKDELIPFETADREYFVNAGRSDRTGLELSLQTEPLENLRLTVSYTYSDFEFDDFIDNDGNDFSGNTIPGIPESFLFAELAYRHPRGYFGTLDFRYVDELYANNSNSVVVDSYTLTNVRAGIELDVGSFTVTPFVGVNNLFDESYNSAIVINAFGPPGGQRYYEPAPDRNIYTGVEIRYDFR